MIKTIKTVMISSLLVMSSNSFACDVEGKTGFLPDNDMYIGVSEKADNGMTEEIFNAVIDRVENYYSSVVASKGANLVTLRKWEDGTVNAYANQVGKTWQVHMFGGLARHRSVSPDGFALVMCHELGHHLAGAPKTTRMWIPTWASNEGQSDYWASMKCFRSVYGSDNNEAIVSNMTIDAEVVKKCEANWNTDSEIALCKRVSQASKGLATLLNGDRPVDFATPDKSVVSKTNHKHPAGQCRLDTYFHGALCTKDITDETSNTDAKAGVCNRSEDYTDGVRPLCWFKPSNF
ncbi:M48 family metalloprotease [Bacteriovorax sp. Seq25_V]|uniref:M48 family metalloprotease n=1 Tax=Bacteriovorax sp. Seq25_V TaxID=1201288 RepID=UPI00038A4659|nr:M48 family metalloprotease [Bacteriovorax sp. Seq25_V]EQC46237.1 peptidase, M48 domain protein [Bacteriovorax sp. Seq25_V]